MSHSVSLHIAGAWRPGGGSLREIVDPATEEVIGTFASADRADLDAALAAAAAGFATWRAAPAYERAQAFVDAGLPAGVLNLVYGVPAEISEYLIRHPVIRKVSFAGSVPVGKHLAMLAGQHMKRVTMDAAKGFSKRQAGSCRRNSA